MNSTSFFYAHTDQWRYESWAWKKCFAAGRRPAYHGAHDRLQRARRAHGLAASALQLQTNPMQVARTRPRRAWTLGTTSCSRSGRQPDHELRDPDHPDNWPRNMFVWRSNILGSSGKGTSTSLKHLLGTTHGVQGKDWGQGRSQARRSAVARQCA